MFLHASTDMSDVQTVNYWVFFAMIVSSCSSLASFKIENYSANNLSTDT